MRGGGQQGQQQDDAQEGGLVGPNSLDFRAEPVRQGVGLKFVPPFASHCSLSGEGGCRMGKQAVYEPRRRGVKVRGLSQFSPATSDVAAKMGLSPSRRPNAATFIVPRAGI